MNYSDLMRAAGLRVVHDCQWCNHDGIHQLEASITNQKTGQTQRVEFWACDTCAARLLKYRSVHDPAARRCLCKRCVAAEFEKWERTIIRKEDA